MKDYPDNELLYLINENVEEASDLLYEKYKYLINVVLKKYTRFMETNNIDKNEARQEAMLGFSDALTNYNQDEIASLSTFIVLCAERRVKNYIKKYKTTKEKINRESISIDYKSEDGYAIYDIIGDSTSDPQIKIEQQEDYENLKKKISDVLSPSELEVCELILNGYTNEDIKEILNKDIKYVYNTSQRIRKKIKDLL